MAHMNTIIYFSLLTNMPVHKLSFVKAHSNRRGIASSLHGRFEIAVKSPRNRSKNRQCKRALMLEEAFRNKQIV